MPPGPTDHKGVALPRRSEVVRARFAIPPSRTASLLIDAAPVALPALFLAWLAIRAIYDRLGHPGAALDDSFIHFQYARAIAEGHPFRYEAGEPATMGATSALWPLLLAPFYWLGCKGLFILWPAWGFSFLAFGLLAREVYLLTKPLAGPHAALGAGAMVFAFSPFTWCAGSGMEVMPFAFCLARAARRSSEWVETSSRTAGFEYELVALAFVTPLFRPEGALASLVVAAALAMAPRTSALRAGIPAAVCLVGAVAPQLLSALVTGALQSNTAQVKLIPGNPYYVGPALWGALHENVHTLLHVLLNGEIWSAEFIPQGSMPFALAGLGAIVWLGWTRERPLRFRAVTIVLLAVAVCAPCAYISFLWNRLRYLWPFASFWLVGLACLTRVVGEALGRVRTGWQRATPILAGLIVGLLGAKVDGAIDDLASSASGIDRQQVALGRWAQTELPKGARIGVNDTGAIAYFGDRATFDVVGLTTRGEGRYWVAGAASRFEHYERVYATKPLSLPSHFIVYPEWMAMSAVLGTRLHDATVTDSTILGGQTMVAYEADYSLLGSGERPWTEGRDGPFVDVLDVADLESERSHAYDLLGARDGEEALTRATSPTGKDVVDGGRRGRSRDRFRVSLPAHATRVIVRLEASETTRVHVFADGDERAAFVVNDGPWSEAVFALCHVSAKPVVELVPDTGTLTTYHYWFEDAEAGCRDR
jgi:hypothetical protein